MKTRSLPPAVYVALSSAEPGRDGSNTAEPSGGSYARAMTAAADWQAIESDPRFMTNAASITFSEATGDWPASGKLTHYALFDSPDRGDFLGGGALTVSKSVATGDTASFDPLALSVPVG